MEFKGTKGVWELKPNDFYIEVRNISEDEKTVFNCNVFLNRETDDCLQHESDSLCEENLANAKLIASAPEILAAMIEFVERVDKGEVRSTKTYNKFKELINKATT